MKTIYSFLAAMGILLSGITYASGFECHEKFAGVMKSKLVNLVDELGGEIGVKAYLKLAKGRFIKFVNLQEEKIITYKAKTKKAYWKQKELSKSKTTEVLADDRVVAFEGNKFTILGRKFKIGTYPDLGGSSRFTWVSIGAQHEGIAELIEDYAVSKNIKGFTNGKDSIYLVDPATGKSLRFKLQNNQNK